MIIFLKINFQSKIFKNKKHSKFIGKYNNNQIETIDFIEK